MTQLRDYLRAERPDLTEPASFYVPGAYSWADVKVLKLKQRKGGDHETPVADSPDQVDIFENDDPASAQLADAFLALHEED